MAEYLSGSIFFSGIGGGTDFTSVIEGLKSIEELPKRRLESWKSDWKVRYDAFDKVINSMREAQTKLSAINNPSKFITKQAKSSKETILTAKADANALDGNHTIDVKQMASNSIWAYNGTYSSKNASVNTSRTDTQTFDYSYKGKEYSVNVPPGTTLESLSNLINKDTKNPGVRMNIVQSGSGYTFQMMGKDTGKAAEIVIHPNNLDGMSSAKNIWSSSVLDPDAAISTSTGDVIYEMIDNSQVPPKNTQIKIPATGTLRDLVDEINKEIPNGAEITTDSNGKSTLTLADSVSISGRGLNGKVTTTDRYVTNVTSSGQVLDPTNPDPDAKVTYTLKDSSGQTHRIDMKAGQTVDELVTAFNAKMDELAIKDPSKLNEKISWGTDPTTGDPRIEQIVGQGALSGPGLTASKDTVSSTWSSTVEPDRVLDSVRYSVTDKEGKVHNFDMAAGESLRDLADKINADPAFGPDTAIIGGNATDGWTLDLTNVRAAKGEGLSGKITGSDTWSIQHAQNAIFKVDNWPNDVESASNTVKNVIEGVEFTIFGEGEATISITADKSSVEKSIQEYLDAVNSVIKTMQDLSKVEEIKPETADSPTYDKSSQFAKSKGGPLTGNYGTQLLNSRMKSLTSDVPPGFERITGTDVLSGDMVASLAQIGIKTCTQEGDPNYGLFMIAPPSTNESLQAADKEAFDNALSKNLEDVVNLFAADGVPRTTSADFHYNSHIKGMAQPGTYEVTYEVTNGVVGDVFINGAKAQANGDNKYTVGGDGGDAKSLSIQLDNLAEGPHSGKISIQQGKIGEMEGFLASELRYNKSEPNKNGSVMILRENYKQIMDNIDKKIEKEEERLIVWERRTRQEYARLDTLLGEYNGQMKTLESQLGGLSTS